MGINNNDLSTEVKKQARKLESVEVDLINRIHKLEALVTQLVGTVEGLRVDIQGMQKRKEQVQTRESSQQVMIPKQHTYTIT